MQAPFFVVQLTPKTRVFGDQELLEAVPSLALQFSTARLTV